jgi:hypothetical protein
MPLEAGGTKQAALSLITTPDREIIKLKVDSDRKLVIIDKAARICRLSRRERAQAISADLISIPSI